MKYLIDTNYILDTPEVINKYECVISSHVLREIENLKSRHGEVGYKARKASRIIEDNQDKLDFDLNDYHFVLNESFDPDYTDNKIIQQCHENGYGLITNDLLLKFKAMGYGIHVVSEVIQKDVNYKGYKEFYVSDSEVTEIYNNLDNNKWGLLQNEYVVLLDQITGEDIDALKWNGQYLETVSSKGFNTKQFGKFKPRDFYQKIAMDSIMSNDITMLTGKAGTAKSMISLYTAWNLIERGKFDKLVIFTNPVKTKDAEALGFYKGSRTEKLLDSQIGIMLQSKFGDSVEVEMLIHQGKLQLLPFSDIRGYDTTSEEKTLVWITEGQNSNVNLMKLALQRIGDNTKIVVEGDPTTQVDMDAYKVNNGMIRLSEVFRGHDIYGEVNLKNIYRSKIASIAEEM